MVDWVAFTPEHVETDLDLFRGRTGQYVFISTASAYAKPLPGLPITESTPLRNPFWAYSRAKIACEEHLTRAYREGGFPVTIVRPSHTYDRTRLPFFGRYTVVTRSAAAASGRPRRWQLAVGADPPRGLRQGFVGLLGNPRRARRSLSHTSDEWPTWGHLRTVARAAGRR